MSSYRTHPKTASYKRFAGIPMAVLNSPNFAKLTAHAVALLIDIREQYNGHNNGRLDATWSRLSKKHRWRSKETLNYAIQELIHYGLLHCESKGRPIAGHPYPSLYSLSWESIDEHQERGIQRTVTPKNSWKIEKPLWIRPQKKAKEKPQVRAA